jgi:[ribosomal protein S5]-alanine N-acetyltransferase
MSNITLRTERLELTAATLEMLQAEEDQPRLAGLLNADVPANWPTPLYDAQARSYFTTLMREQPDALGWAVWYVFLVENGRKTLIGAAGATAPPSAEGTIEIGYSLLDQFHNRGYATEALGGFLSWAWRHTSLRRVIADTFPNLTASIRVLEKCGFALCGPGSEAGAIRFELLRSTCGFTEQNGSDGERK